MIELKMERTSGTTVPWWPVSLLGPQAVSLICINAFQTSVLDPENRQSLFSLLWGTEPKFNFMIVVRKLG